MVQLSPLTMLDMFSLLKKETKIFFHAKFVLLIDFFFKDSYLKYMNILEMLR